MVTLIYQFLKKNSKKSNTNLNYSKGRNLIDHYWILPFFQNHFKHDDFLQSVMAYN